VSLDRLLTEEELCGDLGIRLAVDDKPCDLKLPFGQRLDSGPVGLARPRATVDAMPELSQFAFRLVPVAQRPARLEFAGTRARSFVNRGAMQESVWFADSAFDL
jgi:hypothetical protein